MIVEFANSVWRKFRKTFGKDEYFIFWTSLLFYFLLFFNLNNKTLAIFFALLVFVLFTKFKNLKEALFWGFVISFPITVGKTYLVELIPADQLYTPDNPEGYFLKLVISQGDIIALFMLPLLVRNLFLLWRRRELAFDNILIFLFFLIILVLSSTLNSQNLPVSSFFFLKFLTLPLIFLYSRYLIDWSPKRKDVLLSILLSQVVFEGFFVFLQFAHGGPLGHSLESMTRIVPFGRGTDEDVWRFRPTGTFDHANMVAAFLLPTVILNFAIFYRQKKEGLDYFLLPLIIGMLTLAITLSRSAWGSFLLGIIILTYILEKKYRLRLEEFYRKRFVLIIIFAFLTIPFFIGPRVLSTFNTFVSGGSLVTRVDLIKEALELLHQNPFLGVGLGMSVPEMFKNNPHGMMYFFPSPVHNWYLYFASEVGIFALLAFLFLLYFSFKRLFQRRLVDVFSIGAFVAILVMLFNGILQPFLGNEELLYIFLGMFVAQNKLHD
ncbi:hypothetical protein COU95_00400 [Candidatus Shapirobacteria bacterium CG10_big_fil_rev_8_21_14_0_10_40_9]|uniref:O-antigen ligase-related domain-containing protein n=1 Tax=Candidatus Shapirobacteria bacterium CG10_big_fil_rev_8_21_14_0_10_40_9 TaxID=1974888 RepID=A0A2M8L4E9_9BACT|nr:MAG: hypothetical protein COU95_00400 [Candidatus Shapirobacteria bacterium CG10_big_fil_rev_8_21_14_0_10_40_9]